MTEVYTLHSENGDEYKLQFTTDRSGIISNDILDQLNAQGIEVAEVGLARVKGQNVTSHKMLYQIEECIANLLERKPNLILSYFCDFIHLAKPKEGYVGSGIPQPDVLCDVQEISLTASGVGHVR